MANFLNYLNRPKYLFQPEAVLRRFFPSSKVPEGLQIVQLNWGLPMQVDTREAIGILISRTSIFEISVVEAIFRLTDPADIFLDLGANVGLMSSAALAAGARKILSFEPNPEIHRQLKENIALWVEARPETIDRICARREAISDKQGVAILRTPDRRFQGNHGLSTLESGENDESFSEVEVPTMTLSQVLEQCGGPIGVLKIDIEGHELRVFTACRDLLRAGMVRDIIFEDHAGTNSELSNLLISFGYSVFNLSKTPLGPVLLDRNEPEHWYRVSEDFNFLATLDRDRARRRMARRGFICLRRQYHPRKRP